jgi:hypothetical protein
VKTRFSQAIDVVANVTTIVVLLFFAVFVVQKEFISKNRARKDVETGATMPAISGVQYGTAEKTVLVAATSSCRFCLASMPFYRRLFDHVVTRGRLQFMFIRPANDEMFGRIISQNGLSSAPQAKADFEVLRVSRTPTIIVVDRAGRIDRIWTGKLDEGDEGKEGQVLKYLL